LVFRNKSVNFNFLHKKGKNEMKRISALLMAVVLVVAMSLPAFAAPGAFIASPSGVPAPTLVDFKPLSPDCVGQLVITSWSNRHLLDDASRAILEKAYADIVALNTDAANTLLPVMKAFEDSHGLNHNDLGVGALFDISVVNCTHHEAHDGFIITLRPEVWGNIVGVIHLTENGWEMLEDTMDANAETITFTANTLSPFALVYNTNTDGPTTGDSSNMWIYLTVMAVSVVALGAIGYNLKKREN
jgi:hypothetical protein